MLVCRIDASVEDALRERVRALAGTEVSELIFVGEGDARTIGARLADGRRVVAKLRPRSAADPERVRAVRRIQTALHRAGYPCPEPLGEVVVTDRSVDTLEAYVDAAPGPASPAAMAAALAELVLACRGFSHETDLDAERLGRYPLRPLWRAPHEAGLDFARHAADAAWIDAIALEARRRRYSTPLGPVVVGHNDWRIEHLRFRGGRLVAAFDWDSLVRTREVLLVGSAVRGFTADWTTHYELTVPTLDEAHAFVEAYERARARRFSARERTVLYAGWVDAVAYAARCEHARAEGAMPGGGFQERLAAEAPGLLGIPVPSGTPRP